MKQALLTHFKIYLDQLKDELIKYPDEKAIWRTAPGITNSAGNLCYHLIGNLNHFVGEALGKTGYVRDRPLEFSIKDVSTNDLIAMIDDTILMLEEIIPELELDADYPSEFWQEETITPVYFQLNRLVAHLAYHVGQINYHRRLLG